MRRSFLARRQSAIQNADRFNIIFIDRAQDKNIFSRLPSVNSAAQSISKRPTEEESEAFFMLDGTPPSGQPKNAMYRPTYYGP